MINISDLTGERNNLGLLNPYGDIEAFTPEAKDRIVDQFKYAPVSLPVGLLEGAIGLPGDLEGLVRGGYRAYNADDGERFDAFGSAFGDTVIPSTQQIQNWTDKNLFDNELGNMINKSSGGRLLGEFLAPSTAVTAPIKTGKAVTKTLVNALDNPLLKNAGIGLDLTPSIFKKADIGLTKYALDQGLSGDDLWKTFGITKGDNLGYPGNYISEISDEFAKLKVPGNELQGTKKLGEILEHDELFKVFPELKDTRVAIETGGFKGATDFMPSIKPESPKIILNPGRHADDSDILSTLMHELEHITSYGEGGKPGANIMDIMQKNPSLSAEDALKKYLADSGEVGAGTVQRRLGLDDAGRKANRPDVQGPYGIDIDPKDIVQSDSMPAFGERRGQLTIEDFGDLGIKPEPRKYSDAQNFYDYFNADKVPEANQLGYFEPYYGAPKDDPLNYLLTKSNRGDEIGQLVPKDTPIQPATNTFYDDIRMNDKFPEPTRDSFEFTKGAGDSKGGPVSVVEDINIPYETTKKVLPESDNPFRGPVHTSYLGEADKGVKFDPSLGHEDPLEFFNAPKQDKAEKAVEYLQPKTKQTPTTGITPDRADKLRRGEIKLPEPRNKTVDIDWTRANERPYDTTQFIRDTQGKDGRLFADLARENSQQYPGMFDIMPYSDNIHTKPRFENVADPQYVTPYSNTPIAPSIDESTGFYNKIDVSKRGIDKTKATQLQKEVDTAIDIANNKVRYSSDEERLDAFIKAMEKIEGKNQQYTSKGKSMKAKDEAMQQLHAIHDDLLNKASKSPKRNMIDYESSDSGYRLFAEDTSDVGNGINYD